MPSDVFKQNPCRLALADDAGNVGPQVPLVVCAFALSGCAERLAWVSGKHGIDKAAPWPPVEGGEVVPDRRRGEVSGALTGNEAFARVLLPLDVAGGLKSGFCEVQAEVKPTASCTEGQSPIGT